MIKRIFGNSEEMLLEILLNLGQASASNVIFHSAKRLKEANGGMFIMLLVVHFKILRISFFFKSSR